MKGDRASLESGVSDRSRVEEKPLREVGQGAERLLGMAAMPGPLRFKETK
jgi:hypothetical protein